MEIRRESDGKDAMVVAFRASESVCERKGLEEGGGRKWNLTKANLFTRFERL